jgi:hypothetical protein
MILVLALSSLLSSPIKTVQDSSHRHTGARSTDATVYALPEGDGPARIPIQFLGDHVRIDAMINGAGPFTLILDTGMPIPGVLLMANERVNALHLEGNGQHVSVAGAGGKDGATQALMSSGLSVALGDLKMTNCSALVVPPRPGFPPVIDGVIGGSLFFKFVVRLDVDRARLELFDPTAWTPPEGASIVPLDRQRGMAFIDIGVAVGDEAPVAAHVVVDIGAGHALSLNSHADGRFAPPANAIESTLGRGLNGVVRGKSGRVRRVQIGSFSFANVVAAFPIEAHQNPGGADFHDGNLGEEILRRFVVTFDYAHSRMVLEKGKAFDEPFEHEMLGCSFDWETDGTVTVRDILPDSPAAKAGLEDGDDLIAIDGRAIEALGMTGLHKLLTVDGAELRLELKRGAETVTKKVRLKRLV